MDYLNLMLGIVALAGLVGLAWLGGYESGAAHTISVEREFADRRINGLLDSLNEKKPRLRYRKVNPQHVGRKRYLNTRLPEASK